MTVNYQYNNFHTCIRISKNKKKIENKIKEIQREYRGSKSISIDCDSKFIKFSFLILSLFVLF